MTDSSATGDAAEQDSGASCTQEDGAFTAGQNEKDDDAENRPPGRRASPVAAGATTPVSAASAANPAGSRKSLSGCILNRFRLRKSPSPLTLPSSSRKLQCRGTDDRDSAAEHTPSLSLRSSSKKGKGDPIGGGALKRFSRASSYESLDNEAGQGALSDDGTASTHSGGQQDPEVLPPPSPIGTSRAASEELSYASPLTNGSTTDQQIESVNSPPLQGTMPMLPLFFSAGLSPSPSTPGASGPIMISVMARNNMDRTHSQAKKAKKRKIVGKDKCCRDLINDNSTSSGSYISSRDESEGGKSSAGNGGVQKKTKETEKASDETLSQSLPLPSVTLLQDLAIKQTPPRARILLETVTTKSSLNASLISDLSTPSPSLPSLSRLAIHSPPSSSSSSSGERTNEDDEEDDIDDDDGDESTDSTVINGLPPIGSMPQPQSMSMEDQARFYWDLCYGKSGRSRIAIAAPTIEKSQSQTGSWSASRAGPTRSCLSSKKVSWSAIPSKAKSVKPPSTPTLCDRFNFDKNDNADGVSSLFGPSPASTPAEPVSATFKTVTMRTPNESSSTIIRNVKFGSPKAAEFDKTRPAAELTPLPPALARERFPIHETETESDDESEETHREAARNAAVLAEWEDDFDSYIDDADDDVDGEDDAIDLCSDVGDNMDEENLETSGQEKQATSLPISPQKVEKTKQSKRTSSNARNYRRSSSLFSRVVGVSLLEEGYAEGEFNANISSPKRINCKDDCEDILSNTDDTKVGEGLMGNLLSDLQRSPCFKSPSSTIAHTNSANNGNKETPNSERRSSSSVLRSVHSAGGAGIEDFGISGPSAKKNCRHELRPSQLDPMLQNVEDEGIDFYNQGCDKTDPNCIVSNLIAKPNSSAFWDTETFLRCMMKSGSSAILRNSIEQAIDDMYKLNGHSCVVGTYTLEECSLPDCSRAIDMLPTRSFQSATVCPGFGRQDISEIFTKAVSVLEQQLDVQKAQLLSESGFASNLEILLQSFIDFDLCKVCHSLGQLASNDWQHMETEVLSIAIDWLMPLVEENRASERLFKTHVEKLRNAMRVAKNKVPDCSEENHNLRRRLKETQSDTTRRQVREEQLAVKKLEQAIEEAERQFEGLQREQYRLYAKCEVERNAPHRVVSCLALCSILPFEPSKLSHDAVSIVHLHLDGTRTVLEWNTTLENADLERKSGDNSDSSLHSNESAEGILSEPPHIYRTDASTLTTGESLIGKIPFPRSKTLTIPTDCAAFELYEALLNGNRLHDAIGRRCRYEPENVVLTVSDVLHRLDLVARDVLALQKYYECRVEIPPRMDFVELWATISIGGTCSLGIRFTYDRSDLRSVSYSIPSKVFVKAITGEPAVPLTNLQQVAETAMKQNPLCNAFVLKKTCTAIVETLLGRFI